GLPSLGPDALLSALHRATDEARIGMAVTLIDCDPPEVVSVNRGAAKILGYSVEELRHRSPWEIFAPEDLQRVEVRRQARLRGEDVPPFLQTALTKRTGEKVWVEVATASLKVSGRLLAVSFIFDVTQRREAEQALRESEARFRTLVENAPDGVVILRNGA